MKIEFEIPGKAVGKGRPRFSRRSGHVYTPAKTSEYELSVAAACREAMGLTPPTLGPVQVSISVWRSIPKSWAKKKNHDFFKERTVPRPDVDNIAKAILDGCNGIAYKDDAQVNSLYISKGYGPCDTTLVSIWIPDDERI